MQIWMPLIATGTGAEVYADRLAEGLRARGHAVHLHKAAHRWQYAPWLAGLRPPPGIDVTLANSWSAAAFARPAPLVTVVHHVVHDPAMTPFKSLPQRIFHRGFVLPMERAALRASARVIAISETTAAAIGAHLGRGPGFGPVETVLNGVDVRALTPRAPGPRAPGKLRLLYVGKMSRRKGFDLAVAIADALGDRAELRVIGGAGDVAPPASGAKLLGRVDDAALREAYRDADFLLFPSRQEGFGLVAAEAMACGAPVLCLSGGAVAEIAAPPLAGISAAPEDAMTLGEAALAALADPARMEAMRAEARRRAETLFSEEAWIAGTEAVLRAAAEGR